MAQRQFRSDSPKLRDFFDQEMADLEREGRFPPKGESTVKSLDGQLTVDPRCVAEAFIWDMFETARRSDPGFPDKATAEEWRNLVRVLAGVFSDLVRQAADGCLETSPDDKEWGRAEARRLLAVAVSESSG